MMPIFEASSMCSWLELQLSVLPAGRLVTLSFISLRLMAPVPARSSSFSPSAAVGVKGRTVTLKIMRRKANAPEPPKFMGHGSCDNFTRSKTLARYTDAPADLAREGKDMLLAMRLDATQIRGIGLNVSCRGQQHCSSSGWMLWGVPSGRLQDPGCDLGCCRPQLAATSARPLSAVNGSCNHSKNPCR